MRTPTRPLLPLAAIAGLALATSPALASTYSWTGAVDGTLGFTRAGDLQFSNENSSKAALIILNGGTVRINGAIDKLATPRMAIPAQATSNSTRLAVHSAPRSVSTFPTCPVSKPRSGRT